MNSRGRIVRRARIGPKHSPIPIYLKSGEPIDADSVVVIRWTRDEGIPAVREQYEIRFLSGSDLAATWQRDTLDQCLDEVTALLGLRPEDWEECDEPADE